MRREASLGREPLSHMLEGQVHVVSNLLSLHRPLLPNKIQRFFLLAV
jgi:hypothetical protein